LTWTKTKENCIRQTIKSRFSGKWSIFGPDT